MNAEDTFALDLRGWFVRRQALDAKQMDEWQSALEALEWRPGWMLPRNCLPVWTPTIDEYRIINLLEADTGFLDMVDHEAWKNVAASLIPQPMRMVECYSITRGAGIGLFLHHVRPPIATYTVVDRRPVVTHLKIAVCLDDCGENDGPFCCIEGSHKLGVDFPYGTLNPEWSSTDRDKDHFEFLKTQNAHKITVPWPSIPGFREIHTRRGDVIFFTENLIHGAQGRRNPGFRRTLYAGYSPFHFPNWHGVQYSTRVFTAATDAQRDLLHDPYCGHIFDHSGNDRDPSLFRIGFDRYPNSDAWDRRIPPTPGSEPSASA